MDLNLKNVITMSCIGSRTLNLSLRWFRSWLLCILCRSIILLLSSNLLLNHRVIVSMCSVLFQSFITILRLTCKIYRSLSSVTCCFTAGHVSKSQCFLSRFIQKVWTSGIYLKLRGIWPNMERIKSADSMSDARMDASDWRKADLVVRIVGCASGLHKATSKHYSGLLNQF